MTEVETEFYLYENVTLTTSGTAASSYNRNRNSTNTAGIILSTVTSAATSTANTLTGLTSASALSHGYMGSGFIDGGQTDTRMEWILKQNTAYSLRIIATAAGYTDYLLDWYEHTQPSAWLCPGSCDEGSHRLSFPAIESEYQNRVGAPLQARLEYFLESIS